MSGWLLTAASIAVYLLCMWLLGREKKPKPTPEEPFDPGTASYLQTHFWLNDITHTHDSVLDSLSPEVRKALKDANSEREAAEREAWLWPNGAPGSRVRMNDDEDS